MMEAGEDIVIVGAGIAGLTTSLGLHRLGIRSLILESWSLDMPATWTNAWRALDAVGLADSLRQHHQRLSGIVGTSTISGLQTTERSFEGKEKQ